MVTNWSTSVHSGISSDTEPTFVVAFDNAKYIFNVGENTVRGFLQDKRNWRKTKAVFVTAPETKRISGLPGLLMSFADATIPKLHVIGPSGITHSIASMRRYVYRNTLSVNPIETPDVVSQEPVFKDANLAVYSLPIIPLPPQEAPSNEQTMSVDETLTTKRKRGASPESPSKRQSTDAALSTPPLLFNEFMQRAGFSASALTGEHAQLWRRYVIKGMFPETNLNKSPERSKGKGKNKSIPPTPNVRAPKAPIHPDFYQQLPKFHPTSRDPNFRPCTAYALVGPANRGKFDLEAAVNLGIPSGPLRNQLTKGQSIELKKPDGTTVTIKPEQCVSPGTPPAVNLIFDIPSANHIAPLIASFQESEIFTRLRSSKPEDKKDYDVRVVFHLCGPGVLEDSRYIDFMRGFDVETDHLVVSREYTPDPITFTSAAFSQLRLNQLDPEMFTIPKFNLKAPKDLKDIPNLPVKTQLVAAQVIIGMRPTHPPKKEDLENAEDRFHPAMEQDTIPPLPQLTLDRFREAQQEITETMTEAASPGGDVRVLPLGTGSAIPTKYRNVSATLIQIPGHGSILLDCGEGTWGQLTRQFGIDASTPNNAWDVLRDLKCIFLSHLHGDHHIGVAKLLTQRRLLDPPPKDPLYIVSIRSIHMYLREMSDIEDLGINDEPNGVRSILSEAVHYRLRPQYETRGRWSVGGNEPWTNIDLSRKYAQEMSDLLGLRGMYTVDMDHGTQCYGVTIRHNDGWSIVFSADTRPSPILARVGRDATLLIHEASMADEEHALAEKKSHTTFGEALNIGKQMNAKHILLTHFSGRYPKMPPSGIAPVHENAEQPEPIVALAFDHANLSIGTMWKMNKYMKAISQSFEDTAEPEDAQEEEEMAKMVMELD